MGQLYEKLVDYNNADFYPFHMPGHKRNVNKIVMNNPFKIDITEIEDFDNLHHPTEIIKKLMDFASKVYGTKKTYYLINGSTCGILSAISAVTSKRRKILIARNSHKSVYNAVYLGELTPIYVYPNILEEFGINGIINPEDIQKILTNEQDISAVLITSPTYEGVVSDCKAIAEIVHKFNIPLIVDEAHGAHFSMHDAFPQSAVDLGADIVIQSLHKTLPSLTQTALLHVNSDRVSLAKLERFLSIYQSSSPSYVLLSSIDNCINYVNKERKTLFPTYVNLLNKYRNLIKTLKHIRLLDKSDCLAEYDNSKIVLSVKGTNYTGMQLYKDLLNHYHLQVEMVSSDYIIAMTSCFDQEQGFQRLYQALHEIDNTLSFVENEKVSYPMSIIAKAKYTIAEAVNKETLKKSLKDAIGQVCAEYMYIYPPGVPLIVPGEIITAEIVALCTKYEEAGITIMGLESESFEAVSVIME